MTAQLKRRLLDLLGIQNPQHPGIVAAQHLRRKILRSDARLRNDYLRNTPQPKLQIGGGWHRLDGWLNTDFEPIPGVMMMDATERFPFADQTIDYVYTEHMIEHVPQSQGAFMLQECYRVMRSGGVIRVTTPDLAVIAGLCGDNLSDMQRRYLSWFCDTFVTDGCSSRAAAVMNAFFHLWGHQFLYDELSLTAALRAAGFHSVQRMRLGESSHPSLRKLENTDRYPDGLLDFESVALEALK